MEIKCRHCGESFCPSDESVDLISEEFIFSDNTNICDDCWDIIEYLPDDLSELYTVML
jgi:hypothetical protein